MMAWAEYISGKVDVAVALDSGQCGGSYSDACVLISAIISGVAAELWPGDGIDRRRFAQTWAHDVDVSLDPTLVSLPLLTQWLRKEDREAEAHALEGTRPRMFGLGYGTRLLHGSDIDVPESVVQSVVPCVALRDIRRFTYPLVFYHHVRSNLVHEYKLSDDASSHAHTRLEACVSYVNMYDDKSPSFSRRLIHFHMSWLADITRSIAKSAEAEISKRQQRPRPKVWWADA